MRRGAIEMEKLVAWALGLVIALVFIFVMVKYLSVQNEGSVIRQFIDALFGAG